MTEALRSQLERRAALIARLQEVLVTALRLEIALEDIDPNTPLFGTGLGLDSIDTLEFVLSLEEAFGLDSGRVQSDQYTLRNLNTLADLIEREGAWPR